MFRLSVAQLEARTPEERLEITKLDMTHMGLTKFPMAILTCTNLEYLHLSNNELTSVPRALGNLVTLERLVLSNNKLTSLPREIGNLVNLTEFYLYGNQLTIVPRELGYLVNLRLFSLNKLTSSPCELQNLVNLVFQLNIQYGDKPEFSVIAREAVERIVGVNTFSDLGRLCALFSP